MTFVLVSPCHQAAFRDTPFVKEYGKLLCYDAGMHLGQKMAEAVQVVTNVLGDERFRLPGLHGVSGELELVRWKSQ